MDLRRWESELTLRTLTDHLTLQHLWSARSAVVQVHLWWRVLLAQVSHDLQVEMAGHADVERTCALDVTWEQSVP